MAAESTKTRRRREQLLAVAARLIRARGYHNVSLEDIAAEVGLTGPALYRHFRNKHDLLAQLLLEQIGAVLAVTERPAGDDQTAEEALAEYLAALGALVIEREDSLLWKQERRHLTGEEEVAFRGLARRTLANTSTLIGGVRPDLAAPDLDLLSWSVLSAYSSVTAVRGRLPRSRVELYLRNTALALVGCELGPPNVKSRDLTIPPLPPGRRERIMEAAIRLLDGRGYQAVSMEEIAAESDTAIATVYQCFSGKADLLHAILLRGAEGEHYVATNRLWGGASPSDRLDGLVGDYAELAFGPHGRLLRIFDADVIYLPEDQRASLLGSQREYALQWAETLRAVRPDLTREQTVMRTRTALGLLVDLAETRSVSERPEAVERSGTLVHAVLAS